MGIEAGLPIRPPRRRRAINRDRQIFDAVNRLAENRITIQEFLILSSNFFNPDGKVHLMIMSWRLW
jgi:hypothetical protein